MENLGSQYLQVVESVDDFKRMYPDYESVQNVQFIISNDNLPQYGQQQVVQIQNPEALSGNLQQHQQIQQVQVYQQPGQEQGTQYILQSEEIGVPQQSQIVYQSPVQVAAPPEIQMQREEPTNEQQYYLELQTPQEQAQQAAERAFHQQMQISQASPTINQNQVILQQTPSQQILVHHQPSTPQNQHYFVTTPQQQPQYFMPQGQESVQTRIVYQTPPQIHQIQNAQSQKTLVLPRQTIYSVPTSVRPHQLQIQQTQHNAMTQQLQNVKIVRTQVPQTQILGPRQQIQQQLPRHITIQAQNPQPQPVQQMPTPRQRASRPRAPRGQNTRMQRPPPPQVQQVGLQQPSPQNVTAPSKVIYRIATPTRQMSPNPTQTIGVQKVMQRLGGNVRLQLPTGQRLIVQQPQMQGQSPQQVTRYIQVQTENTPTTSLVTMKKTESQPKSEDPDDIESSITAAIVTKHADQEENVMQDYEQTKRQQEMMGQVKKPVTGPQTAIRPATHLTSRTTEESQERESAKMLVILQSGEQRLITFTLPKECCTVQELLEQVGVPFSADSTIRCISNPGADIDYVVTVGVPVEDSNEMMAAAENTLKAQSAQVNPDLQKTVNTQQQLQNQMAAMQGHGKASIFNPNTNKKPDTPEPSNKKDDPPPKYLKGYVAICNYCGASSLDHAKCQRCKRVFKGDVRIMPLSTTQPRQVIKVPETTMVEKKPVQFLAKVSPNKPNTPLGRPESVRGRGGATRGRGRGRAMKHEDPIVLTLSSDDEENSKASSTSNGNSKNGTPNNGINNSFVTPLKCEPTLPERNEIPPDFTRDNILNGLRTGVVLCRNIRIGSHKYDPTEKVAFSTKGCRIVAPSVKRPNELVVLNIQISEIVKILYSFDKRLCVIYIFVLPSCGVYIRESLEMGSTPDSGPYFNPVSLDGTQKRIILILEDGGPEIREKLRTLFSSNKLEEIPHQDANELLLRSYKDPNNAAGSQTKNENQNILVYPKEGKGRITININDYCCLAIDQYLNDVIIDFYIKYLMDEVLTLEQRERTHVFSTFFYKRLTTIEKNRARVDSKLTAAQKRYHRVMKWVKDVDLFKKDFIIIPINEQSHWFLAMICFPRLQGPVTTEGERPVKTPLVKRAKKNAAAKKQMTQIQIGNTTITTLKKPKLESIDVPGDESERDEAEGDDSELNTDDSGEEDTADPELQPIKQPCILIFDSLAGTSRSRVVATLRDYLTCEHRAKNNTKDNPYVFNKDNLPGHCVKVPQQNNFTDCGLYLLQYVEAFFQNPIKDWRLPIKGLQNWFEPLTVTKKREDISNLLIEKVREYDSSNLPLPKLDFPTKDGVLLEMDETAEFEEAEMETDAELEDNDPDEGSKPKKRKTDEQIVA